MFDILNGVTLKPYQGKNADNLTNFMLQNNFVNPKFATMLQWNSIGRCIKAGSKSCAIMWIDSNSADANMRDERGRNVAYKSYRVFNYEQTREYTAEERAKHEARKAYWDSRNDQSGGVSVAS